MDRVSTEVRSKIMSRVRTRDTGPELLLRSSLHRLGYRYRLHSEALPGKPDLVFPARRKVIFVHGCFWHGHGCRWGKLPKSRPEYWEPKIDGNQRRDRAVLRLLRRSGWQALVIWQCELRVLDKALAKAVQFLEGESLSKKKRGMP